MSDERRSKRATPSQRLGDNGFEFSACGEIEALERVDRTQHLLHRTSLCIEIELDVVSHAKHAMPTHGQSLSVDLESVSKTWLHHSLTSLDLRE